ncbi:PLD nuclease N-terminal domain-containing protein [Pseudactinotalea sp. Z1748]|uniref:PLD nuclease N-terminal domain-containing protein n=1 Tax=Pseudactinotalea sp. Z1748 TaxID=3413027 RepID=UPI003C7E1740
MFDAVAGGLVVVVFGLAWLALIVAALMSIAQSRNYTSGLKALWMLAVFALPFLGTLAWFLIGRHSHS